MKKLIFLPLLLSSFYLSAFEVYGLKSGMTKAEFYELTNCQAFIDNYNSTKSSYEKDKKLESCYSYDGDLASFQGAVDSNLDYFKKWKLGYSRIYVGWTHEEKLYRVQIYYVKSDESIQQVAQRRAVKAVNHGKEFKEDTIRTQYGATDFLVIDYVDNSLFKAAEEHYFQNYLETYNNKK